MTLTVQNIIKICREGQPLFLQTLEGFTHEIKGLMNSEMLLFCAMSKHLGAAHVLESGRARGNSTETLARFFAASSGVRVFSVECLKYTEDSVIATRRLYNRHDNLSLLFGDSFAVLPDLCSRRVPCTVLIDGPKGKYALHLASVLLGMQQVKAVFIHDSHKDTEHRPAIESLYPETFSSDAPDFVEAFSPLDAPCWEAYRNWEGYRDWGPYQRGPRTMRSYGPTLTMILNAPGGIDRQREVRDLFALSPMPPRHGPLGRWLRTLRRSLPNASEWPFFLEYWGTLLRRQL